METLCPASLVSSSPRWLIHHSHSTSWTKEENKRFESALAIFDDKTPNRWFHVAAMIPGKSVYDVMNQYRELVADVSDIEAGLVPVPGYMASSFTVELAEEHHGFDVFRKRGRTYNSDQERKKGVPWTEDEHRRFLLGLEKHGKGDWRNISRNFVISKTPTQVASHAQKYYLRQLSGGKDKKRPSIHDITTTTDTHTNTTNNKPISSSNNNNQLIITSHVQTPSISVDHSMHNRGANLMVFDSAFAARPNDIASRFIVNIGASDQGFGLQSAPRNSHF